MKGLCKFVVSHYVTRGQTGHSLSWPYFVYKPGTRGRFDPHFIQGRDRHRSGEAHSAMRNKSYNDHVGWTMNLQKISHVMITVGQSNIKVVVPFPPEREEGRETERISRLPMNIS